MSTSNGRGSNSNGSCHTSPSRLAAVKLFEQFNIPLGFPSALPDMPNAAIADINPVDGNRRASAEFIGGRLSIPDGRGGFRCAAAFLLPAFNGARAACVPTTREF